MTSRNTHTPAEQEQFLKLINENKGIIYKICHSYCLKDADREDLVQEIIYQLWKSGHSFDGERRFSTWMYRVALNVAISFYRKNQREPGTVALSEMEENLEEEKPSGEPEEKIRALQRSIAELKELDRALMILYLDGSPYKEIAEILGITETNVASKISRIKDKLKEKILSTYQDHGRH
ncbi:MAG: sigma-70 family RNA polymerase sigma factor [Bacteroidota bacterium]